MRGGPQWVEGLKRALGSSKVYDDESIVRLYLREPSGFEGSAWAVAFPESPEDVSVLVSYAYKHGVPLYPQGSTTDLSGGSIPEGGLVVSFHRMNRVLEVSSVDSIAVVEPGVRLGDLNAELASIGYMFPVDPGSVRVATVGGAINSGAGGMRGAKYGTMRDWVLGLGVVIPDERGTLLRIGCRVVKCRQGYDLVRLIVGSEGTLGLVVEATLRIAPLPESLVTGLGFFSSMSQVLGVVHEIKSRGVQPQIMEYMDPESTRASMRISGVGFGGEGHMLLVSLEGCPEASDRLARWLSGLMESHGALKVVTSRSMREAEDKGLFDLRRNYFAATVLAFREESGSERTLVYIEDITVPPSRVGEAYSRIIELSRSLGLKVFVGGHIGDGNLHPKVGFDPGKPEDRKAVEEWYMGVMKIAVDLGGTVSGEHGIGVLKKEGLRYELEARGSLKALEIMRNIKRAFDPKNILNPGKVVDI